MTIVEQGTLGDLPYAIISTEMGSLCGYLGVPPSHPWYGQDYDDVDAEVHGGLTYGDASHYGKPQEVERLQVKLRAAEKGYFPPSFYLRQLDVEIKKRGAPRNYPIETDLDLWWFGFDCAHYQDVVPGMAEYSWVNNEGATYKDRDFVYKELEGLASQAYDAAREAVTP